jgi:hypothetical protein
LSFDEACGLIASLAGFGPAGGALAGPFVLDVDDRQPRQLDDGVVGGAVPAGLGDLAELIVEGLDAVGNRYEDARRRRFLPLPVFPRMGGWAYGATVRDKAPGVKQGGQAGLARWAESPC